MAQTDRSRSQLDPVAGRLRKRACFAAEAGSGVVGWWGSLIAARGIARRAVGIVMVESMRVGDRYMGVGIAGVGCMRRVDGRCSLLEWEEGRSGWAGRSLGRRIG